MSANISCKNIDMLALRLLKEHRAFNGYTRVVEIANHLGLQVVSAGFKDNKISGMLMLNNDEQNIYVNATEPVVRQRFTIAHEIGHYVLHNDIIAHQQGNIFYRDQLHSHHPMEREANRFAAALLIPQDSAISDWKHIHNIVVFASFYMVSVDTAKYRLQELGLIKL